MSLRGTDTFQALSSQAQLYPVFLLRFEFAQDCFEADRFVRLWNGSGLLRWKGESFSGTGSLLKIGPYSEQSGARASGLNIELSGQSPVLMELLEGLKPWHYQGRPCKGWVGITDSSGELIADAVPIFHRKMDVLSLQDEGDSARVVLSVENRFDDLNRQETERHSHVDQKARYKSDEGLAFLTSLKDKVIPWGRTTS